MRKAAVLIIAIGLLCVSCGKTDDNEWSRFYGFTQADVIGHYDANPDESLYEELPAGMVVYDNATIDISAVGSSASIAAHIVIPGIINKSFSGPLNMSDENRSDITLTTIFNSLNKSVKFISNYCR